MEPVCSLGVLDWTPRNRLLEIGSFLVTRPARTDEDLPLFKFSEPRSQRGRLLTAEMERKLNENIYGLPYQPHSDTSRAAALQAQPRAHTDRARVLRYLKHCGLGGSTDEEMQEQLGMNPNSQRPRRRELVIAGYARDSRLRRKTKSGCQAVIWQSCEALADKYRTDVIEDERLT